MKLLNDENKEIFLLVLYEGQIAGKQIELGNCCFGLSYIHVYDIINDNDNFCWLLRVLLFLWKRYVVVVLAQLIKIHPHIKMILL